jgi:hypothetical protein
MEPYGVSPTARKASSLKEGFHSDGQGLYLRIRKNGSKAWVFRFTQDGRTQEIGLGPTHTRTLAEARRVSAEIRALRMQGRILAWLCRKTTLMMQKKPLRDAPKP